MKKFFSTHTLTITNGQSITVALWQLFMTQDISRSFKSFVRHYYLWRAAQSTMIPGANAA